MLIKQLILSLIWASLAITCTACGQNSPQKAYNYPLHSFTQHGVQVNIELVIEEKEATLSAEYIPLDPSLHLYGKDLPPDGIDGVGRPTHLEIIRGIAQPTGTLTTNVVPTDYQIPGFNEPFPLYPNGSVTLQLPIQLLEEKPAIATIDLIVRYMACSSEGACKPPVNQQFTVSIPDTVWDVLGR